MHSVKGLWNGVLVCLFLWFVTAPQARGEIPGSLGTEEGFTSPIQLGPPMAMPLATFGTPGGSLRVLAAADFDHDDQTDVVGVRAADDGDVLLFFHGLASTAQRQQREPVQVSGPLDKSTSFLTVGDFNADGHLDLAAAAPGGMRLSWIFGDGKGGFTPPRVVELPGKVRAMESGHFLRRWGVQQVVVALDGERRVQLAVFDSFDGASKATPLLVEVPAAVQVGSAPALALADVDGDFLADLIILSNGEALIPSWNYERPDAGEADAPLERLTATFEKLPLPRTVRAVVGGAFLPSEGGEQLAFLAESGELIFARRVFAAEQRWTSAVCAVEGRAEATLAVARLMGPSAGTYLVLGDREQRKIRLLRAQQDGCFGEEASRALKKEPAVIVPLDGGDLPFHHLLVLDGTGTAPVLFRSVPRRTFVVNTDDDTDDGACDVRHCSLREAILAANQAQGWDAIVFGMDDQGPAVIRPRSPLPKVQDPLWLRSKSQLVLDGSEAGPKAVGLDVVGGWSTVQGLEVRTFASDGVVLRRGGHNVIVGNHLGARSAKGEVSFGGNGGSGIVVVSAGNLLKRNVVAGNGASGIEIFGRASINNRVEGNLVLGLGRGEALSAEGVGIRLGGLARGNHIGGLLADSGNDIGFHAGHGVAVGSAAYHVVQGNEVHDNGGSGVYFESWGLSNTSCSNRIHSNGRQGVEIGSTENGPQPPELPTVVFEDGAARLNGMFRGEAESRYHVEFFENVLPDFDQGEKPSGLATFWTDGKGEADLTSLLPSRFNGRLTLAAMDPGGNVTEFSGDTNLERCCVPLTLIVTKDETEAPGTVMGPGIDCGADCSEEYDGPSEFVELWVISDASWTWSGPCTGTNKGCDFFMTVPTNVGIKFFYPKVLTVSKSGTGGGTVTSIPAGISCGADCTQEYNPGTSVTLTASPDASSTFSGWSGGGCSGTGTCTVTVEEAVTVTAAFTLKTASLSVSKSGTGDGTVTSTPGGISCGGDCSESYNHGTSVTLTALPDAWSTFSGWSGGFCSGTGTCTVTVEEAVTVTVVFTLKTASLSVSKSGTGGGTVTSSPGGISCGGDCSESYNHGTLVTLTASPDAWSEFTDWSGGGCSGPGVCVVTVEESLTVTAFFTLKPVELNVGKLGAGMGTVTSSPAGISCGVDCGQTFDHGTVVTLTPSPALGSVFVEWSGACSGSGSCTVTMEEAETVLATFGLTRTLTVTQSGTGNGTVTSMPAGIDCGADCTQDYDDGTSVTLTPTPIASSVFTGWSGACSGTGACTVTMDAAKTVTATFDVFHTLSVLKAGTGNGMVTSSPVGIDCGADCAEDYVHGTVVNLTVAPDAWSNFLDWSGGGCSGQGACTVTVEEALTVTAFFTLKPVELIVGKEGDGSGTVTSSPAGIDCGADCGHIYGHGTLVTLTASPTCSDFVGWSGCTPVPGSPEQCTVTLDELVSVTATFDAQPAASTLTVVTAGSGTVTSAPAGIECGADCSEEFACGAEVTLTATPSDPEFFNWGGACAGNAATCTVTMDEATVVVATFGPTLIFADGFERGDTSAWDATSN